MNLLDLIRGGPQAQTPTSGRGFGGGDPLMDLILRQAAQLPTVTGGNGGGIVPTSEQVAESEAAARYLGVGDVEVQDDPIIVSGQRVRPGLNIPLNEEAYAMPDGVPALGNNQWIEEGMAAQENAPERKGVFGTKGTLRDILGTIGDAFLIQSGNKPMYAPRKQQEQMMDAMAGMTANPMAAAERMTQADPAAAWEMMQNIGTQQKTQQEAQRLAEKARLENYEKGATFFSQYIAGADKDTYDRMKPLLNNIKKRFGLGDEFMVPDTYDEALSQSYGRGAMKTNQQITTQQGDRRLDLTEDRNQVLERQGDTRNAISQQRANRPPAGRAPRAETADEKFIRLSDKPNPTKGEREWLETRRNNGRSSGRGGSRSSGRRAVTPPSRFRPVR